MLQVSTNSLLNTPKPSSPPSNGKSSYPSTGLFDPSQSTRISILNGSHNTLSHEEDHETVLIFPDFKAASEVRRSVQGAQDLWDSSVAPGISRSGAFLEKTTLRTWVLPYACVILLCSHKKRDNSLHHIIRISRMGRRQTCGVSFSDHGASVGGNERHSRRAGGEHCVTSQGQHGIQTCSHHQDLTCRRAQVRR